VANKNTQGHALAKQARQIFVVRVSGVLPDLARSIGDRLMALAEQTGTSRDQQERQDAWQAFRPCSSQWAAATAKAWEAALIAGPTAPANEVAAPTLSKAKFALMDDEIVETKILGSKMVLHIMDSVSFELNDFRLRLQGLEGVDDLSKEDIVRPETLVQLMVDQWTAVKLNRNVWAMAQDAIRTKLARQLVDAYHEANEFLVKQGVMAEIDLRPLVKRGGSATGSSSDPAALAKADAPPEPPQAPRNSLTPRRFGEPRQAPQSPQARPDPREDYGHSGLITNAIPRPASEAAPQRVGRPYSGGSLVRPASSYGSDSGRSRDSGGGSPHDETRMQTATTPLGRARMRAQGVMGHLRRLLSNNVPGFDDTRGTHASPQLMRAMDNVATRNAGAGNTVAADADGMVYSIDDVSQAAGALRERTAELKKAANTQTEKATIEIVALMFQSILAEERIAPGIRVWFARLQMPVLRLALAEPEFFESLQHPARRLIDRMGSCVLGFDVAVSGSAMELEIKRIVQVIEQYPETGRRVFQLVFDEFQKFLSKFLSTNGGAAKAVSVAQQMEQKETLVIQCTIEMRNMLNDMPVRDEIREFLFKVWAEVLAIAGVKNGPQHEQTLELKKAAADLVWSASAKPDREDRAKVIANLPKLLQTLRMGMSSLNMDTESQDEQLKIISDTLADDFLSKTDVISQERIDHMAKRLVNLEDYLSDEDVGDLPLDTEALVMMIGIDAAGIEVVTEGGSQPSEAMRSWANELQLGDWFNLDHLGRITQVQFSWRSDRKQLHLFAAADGRNFLIQARRLAAYLQAGLLVPSEEEALTVRATRDALAKLDASPDLLFS
jgi:Protein of unknown function (DUF1631)